MKNILRKLHSNRGETLVEALAAILIIALASSVLLYSAVNASKVNQKASENNARYRQEINDAEGKMDKKGTGNLLLKDSSGKSIKIISVDFYGSGSGLTNYQKAEENQDGD